MILLLPHLQLSSISDDLKKAIDKTWGSVDDMLDEVGFSLVHKRQVTSVYIEGV